AHERLQQRLPLLHHAQPRLHQALLPGERRLQPRAVRARDDGDLLQGAHPAGLRRAHGARHEQPVPRTPRRREDRTRPDLAADARTGGMMTEPQPEYVWAHPETRPRRGRAWLIVALAVVAVAIAAAVFLLFLQPGAPLAQPTPTSSASPSASPSTSPSAAASDGPTATASPEPTFISTPPPAPDPDLATFRERVSPVLADARRGFQIAAESDAQEAAETIGFLQDDA